MNSDLRIEPLEAPRHWRLTGDLDLASAGQLEATLEPFLNEAGDVTLDASGLTFVDSSGIRTLVRVSLRLGSHHLIVVRPGKSLRRLFDLTGLRTSGRVDLRDQDCCV